MKNKEDVRSETCGSIFRRQKLFIGTPNEKIQWCCIQHIRSKSECEQKGVREEVIQSAFIAMWNKLVSNYENILVPLLESLKGFPVSREQTVKIYECENRILELTKQSKILSATAANGYLDSAIFYERLSVLKEEMTAEKDRLNVLNRGSCFITEIRKTEILIQLIQNNPEFLAAYQEKLYIQAVEKIVIGKRKTITFHLINQLELTEHWGKE